MLSEEHASYFRQAVTPENGQSTSQDVNGGNGANILSILASPVSHCGRPSLLECLSEMTLFQMSEAKIGEIQTLLFVGEALDPKETCLKLILSQR